MAENTKIEWAHHTFNGWIGCTKVGPGCDHCYAADLAQARLGVPWGPGQPRRRTAASTWKQPRRWNNRAAKLGIRYRVFCSSLADVFDNEVPAEWRADLFHLIRETPHLDWLLVTKRIGNAAKMAEAAGGFPGNVWLGATIVNQMEADRDIPKLLQTEGPHFRFLSMEPLLGAVNIEPWLNPDLTCLGCDDGEGYGNRCSSDKIPRGEQCPWNRAVQIVRDHGPYGADGEPAAVTSEVRTLDWVIVGGESGPKARPMHPDWARGLRDQCDAAGVPMLFKQWGEWSPTSAVDGYSHGPGKNLRQFPNSPGLAWLADGRIVMRDFTVAEHQRRIRAGEAHNTRAVEEDMDALRAFWATLDLTEGPVNPLGYQWMYRIGKKVAGRLLDGVQHDGMPAHG